MSASAKARPSGALRNKRRWVAGMLIAAVLASCGSRAPSSDRLAASTPPSHASKASPGAESWTGRSIHGIPGGVALQDMAVNDSGVLVAVGAVASEELTEGESLVIWRSQDGLSWREAFRRQERLRDGDAYVGTQMTVAAHDDGFAVVASDCGDRCVPLALYSPNGTEWTEVQVPVRPPAGEEAGAGRSGGGRTAAPVGPARLAFGTPEYMLQGAEMLDMVAIGSRLVAVGWSEAGRYDTVPAVWHSDDGGRTWRQAEANAVPAPHQHGRDQWDKVVVAGDHLVAGGGKPVPFL